VRLQSETDAAVGGRGWGSERQVGFCLPIFCLPMENAIDNTQEQILFVLHHPDPVLGSALQQARVCRNITPALWAWAVGPAADIISPGAGWLQGCSQLTTQEIAS